MKALWIGKELSEEIREYVHSELKLPGKANLLTKDFDISPSSGGSK